MATDDSTGDYMAAFTAFKGKDNSLTSGEFIRLMVVLGVEGGADTARAILKKINKDGDAKITEKEFLQAVKQPGVNNRQIRRLKAVFDKFDYDNTGWASHKDVIRILPELGLTEAQVKKQVEELDANKDGKIRFTDFLRVQLNI